MFDKNTVQKIASDNSFYQLVVAIANGHYSHILSNYSELMEQINDDDIPEMEA